MAEEKQAASERFAALEESIDKVNDDFSSLDEGVIGAFAKYQTELDAIEKHVLDQMNTARLAIVKNISLNETLAIGRNKHLKISIERFRRRSELSNGETHAPTLYNVMNMRALVDSAASGIPRIHDKIFHPALPQFIHFPLAESFWKTSFISNSAYPITRSLSTLADSKNVTVGDRLDWPFGIAIHPVTGLIYVADYGNHRVAILNNDGSYLRSLSKFENGTSFQNPNGVAFSKDGSFLVVTDHCANKVHIIDGKTELIISTLGKQGGDEGSFAEPRFVVFDNDDFFYVTDLRNDRIQKFNTEGKMVGILGNKETTHTLKNPMAIMLNDSNELMIVSPGESQVSVYSTEGEFRRLIPIKKTSQYTFIARGPGGGFAISDYTDDKVHFYEADGTHIKTVDSPGAAGCIFDQSGRFLVLDRKNHQLFEF